MNNFKAIRRGTISSSVYFTFIGFILNFVLGRIILYWARVRKKYPSILIFYRYEFISRCKREKKSYKNKHFRKVFFSAIYEQYFFSLFCKKEISSSCRSYRTSGFFFEIIYGLTSIERLISLFWIFSFVEYLQVFLSDQKLMGARADLICKMKCSPPITI